MGERNKKKTKNEEKKQRTAKMEVVQSFLFVKGFIFAVTVLSSSVDVI